MMSRTCFYLGCTFLLMMNTSSVGSALGTHSPSGQWGHHCQGTLSQHWGWSRNNSTTLCFEIFTARGDKYLGWHHDIVPRGLCQKMRLVVNIVTDVTCHWWRLVTWPEYWPVIGPEPPHVKMSPDFIRCSGHKQHQHYRLSMRLRVSQFPTDCMLNSSYKVLIYPETKLLWVK